MTEQIELKLSYPKHNVVNIDFKAFVPEQTNIDQTFNLNVKCTLVLQFNQEKPELFINAEYAARNARTTRSTENDFSTTRRIEESNMSQRLDTPARGDSGNMFDDEYAYDEYAYDRKKPISENMATSGSNPESIRIRGGSQDFDDTDQEVEKTVSIIISNENSSKSYLYVCIILGIFVAILIIVVLSKYFLDCCRKEVRFVDHYSVCGNKYNTRYRSVSYML